MYPAVHLPINEDHESSTGYIGKFRFYIAHTNCRPDFHPPAFTSLLYDKRMRLRKCDICFVLNLNIQIRNLTDISGSILPVGYFWGELFKNDDFVGNMENKNDDFVVNSICETLLNDILLSVNLGYLYENIATQMLNANGNELFYYTFMNEKTRHNYEIDFILTRNNKICKRIKIC